MASIAPFRALRPTPEHAAAVAAVPYDVVTTEEARQLAAGNPLIVGDVLYTVTLNNLIKMNDLESLDEIGELEIGPTGGILKYPTLEGGQ